MDMTLHTGSLLKNGEYRIEKVLGKGGFGITYLAVQQSLDRNVAVKEFFMKEYCERDETDSRVSLGSSGSREMVERFKKKFIKEAQTLAGLDDHHIVKVYDVFEENGTAYYVMEYLQGGDLDGRIPSTGLPEEETLIYIRQIADALSYIHRRNILHLDVKPSNILFRNEVELVLIDFGISKRYDETGVQTSSTPAGISKGYAPLEQYNQGIGSFSAATDVYSLAATLFRMLTGCTPPEASIVNEDGLPALPKNVSSAVADAVTKGMQPRRKDRPQSIAEFLNMIDPAAETEIDDVCIVYGPPSAYLKRDVDVNEVTFLEVSGVKDEEQVFPEGWTRFYKIFFPAYHWKYYSVKAKVLISIAAVFLYLFAVIQSKAFFLILFLVFVFFGVFFYPFAIKELFVKNGMSRAQYRLTVTGTIVSLGLSFGLSVLLANVSYVVYALLTRLGMLRKYDGGMKKLLVSLVLAPAILLGGFVIVCIVLIFFGAGS